jgi:hypothetical protein
VLQATDGTEGTDKAAASLEK